MSLTPFAQLLDLYRLWKGGKELDRLCKYTAL